MLSNGKRSRPPVKAVLPPRSARGAFSRTRTRAPVSRADRAAQRPALPAPTTTTSNGCMGRPPPPNPLPPPGGKGACFVPPPPLGGGGRIRPRRVGAGGGGCCRPVQPFGKNPTLGGVR